MSGSASGEGGGSRVTCPLRGEGAGGMKSNLCHELLMPQGSHFSCFAKKSNQKKARDADIRPDPRFEATR